jgi:hypothetical protein
VAVPAEQDAARSTELAGSARHDRTAFSHGPGAPSPGPLSLTMVATTGTLESALVTRCASSAIARRLPGYLGAGLVCAGFAIVPWARAGEIRIGTDHCESGVPSDRPRRPPVRGSAAPRPNLRLSVELTSQRSVQVSRFADIGLLTPLRRLIRFLCVGPALCLRLPSDSQAPATPLPFGYHFRLPGVRTSTSK